MTEVIWKELLTMTKIRMLVNIAMTLAFLVVMLGAYTRLTDAGLGCPDWPGCYGHWVIPEPSHDQVLSLTQSRYSLPLIESRKAWTEMIHRYAAGTLGLLIVLIGFQVFRKAGPMYRWKLPVLLMFLVVFQALLGMWTVTLKLLPIVVMSHLLGGMLIFSCLVCIRLHLSERAFSTALSPYRGLIGLACLIVFAQIALGGWVSANYAGIACIGFPQCNGQWLPHLHFADGFNLFSPVGQNYQGGVLDNGIRVTIQWIHRVGAFLTVSYLLLLAGVLFRKVKDSRAQFLVMTTVILLLVQFLLGIGNVIFRLPIVIAVAHNGTAALLIATVFALFSLSRQRI